MTRRSSATPSSRRTAAATSRCSCQAGWLASTTCRTRSASEWIWNRRLQLCYDRIAKGDARSITAIAFDHGFNSSAHFSTMFRRKYGVSPREIARSSR
jgi:AraC-like DNA-binding protein